MFAKFHTVAILNQRLNMANPPKSSFEMGKKNPFIYLYMSKCYLHQK